MWVEEFIFGELGHILFDNWIYIDPPQILISSIANQIV